jgi:hypothetical protein
MELKENPFPSGVRSNDIDVDAFDNVNNCDGFNFNTNEHCEFNFAAMHMQRHEHLHAATTAKIANL